MDTKSNWIFIVQNWEVLSHDINKPAHVHQHSLSDDSCQRKLKKWKLSRAYILFSPINNNWWVWKNKHSTETLVLCLQGQSNNKKHFLRNHRDKNTCIIQHCWNKSFPYEAYNVQFFLTLSEVLMQLCGHVSLCGTSLCQNILSTPMYIQRWKKIESP